VRAATRKEVVAKLGAGTSVIAALEALLRLRQAACHPALVPGQQRGTSSKVDRLVESLEDAAADGHKALVFSQWTSSSIASSLTCARPASPSSASTARPAIAAAVVAAFQDESGPPVMLISLKAGGTGLNLTAADHVFLLDPWWNPAVEDQAADRAHRIGQDKPVMVIASSPRTPWRRGSSPSRSASAPSDAALGEADRAAALTREDLLALLQ
jgi:hypothetical protein